LNERNYSERESIIIFYKKQKCYTLYKILCSRIKICVGGGDGGDGVQRKIRIRRYLIPPRQTIFIFCYRILKGKWIKHRTRLFPTHERNWILSYYENSKRIRDLLYGGRPLFKPQGY
jgi:hypothetical protein